MHIRTYGGISVAANYGLAIARQRWRNTKGDALALAASLER